MIFTTLPLFRSFRLLPVPVSASHLGHIVNFRCALKSHSSKLRISSTSYHSQRSMADVDVQEIVEGKARVLLPKSVFYNPVQEFNRDLTNCVISQFAEEYVAVEPKQHTKKQGKSDIRVEHESTEAVSTDPCQARTEGKETGVRIFEGLAASGLRSIRFGLEIPGVKEVIANDFDKKAVEFIEKNISKNGLTGRVKSSFGDASMVMYQNKGFDKRFDVIDLDPYGSASQFLDAAVQAVGEGGLLCVTCTDAAVLCGNAGETCYCKYGSLSLRGKFCHEMAIRILLHCIESHANRYSRHTVPLISLSIDFYFRVFVRVYTSQKQAKMAVTKSSMVFHCVGCGTFHLQPMATAAQTKGDNYKFTPGVAPPVGPRCDHCGHKHQIGGPIWSAPLHDVGFVERVLARVDRDPGLFGTSDRIRGMLTVVREELQDVPLYYILDELCGVLHCTPPNMLQMRSAILNAGYRVSFSHAAKNSYKTDAPASVIWDVMRCWVKDHPVSAKRLTEGSMAHAILQQPPTVKATFDSHPEANPTSRQKGLVRWQINPEPCWGPKARARRVDGKDTEGGRKRDEAEMEETGEAETGEMEGTGEAETGEMEIGETQLEATGVKRVLEQGETAERVSKAPKADGLDGQGKAL